MTTGVFACWENQFSIGDNAENAAFIADCVTFSVAVEGEIDEYGAHGSAWKRAFMIGKSGKITITAKRNIGDVGNDYLASKFLKVGREAFAYLSLNMPDGSKYEFFNCVVNVKNIGTGEGPSMAQLEAEITTNGEPVFTPAPKDEEGTDEGDQT